MLPPQRGCTGKQTVLKSLPVHRAHTHKHDILETGVEKTQVTLYEFHTFLLQNSSQFMRHAKRRKLTVEDFNRGLRWSNTEVNLHHARTCDNRALKGRLSHGKTKKRVENI